MDSGTRRVLVQVDPKASVADLAAVMAAVAAIYPDVVVSMVDYDDHGRLRLWTSTDPLDVELRDMIETA